MAIQVRADLTPAEFDTVRDALAAYAESNTALTKLSLKEREQAGLVPADIRKASERALKAADLLRRLR